MKDLNGVAQEGLLAAVGEAEREAGPWDGVLALYTHKVSWGSGLPSGDLDHLLEVRAYNEGAEYHALRGAMGELFSCRLAQDDDYDAFVDDRQLLDISDKESVGSRYVTTGGGPYELPVEGARRIWLRNYVRFDESSGMAHVVDFRIVGLLCD